MTALLWQETETSLPVLRLFRRKRRDGGRYEPTRHEITILRVIERLGPDTDYLTIQNYLVTANLFYLCHYFPRKTPVWRLMTALRNTNLPANINVVLRLHHFKLLSRIVVPGVAELFGHHYNLTYAGRRWI